MSMPMVHMWNGCGTVCGIWWSDRSGAWVVTPRATSPTIDHTGDPKRVTCGACKATATMRELLHDA